VLYLYKKIKMNRILLALLLLPITAFSQTLAPPTISHVSGFYTDSFYVKITHPDPDVTILYTLDGSEPRIENLTGKVWNYKKVYPTNPGDAFGALLEDTIWTYEYTDSILVRDRSSEPDRYADISTSYYTNQWYTYMAQPDSVDVFKGVILRIVAYKDNLYSTINTKNYFVSQQGGDRYSLPVICLTIEPDKFFSYQTGLNVPGLLFDEWRADNPQEEITSLSPGNFRAEGSESEISAHFSYIENNTEFLNHGIGLRLHGNGSRVFPNRSLRLYAKSEYGVNNFNYPFFKNYSVSKFKRIILRNSGNDCVNTMFRDGFIQTAVSNLNFETQEYQPCILLINGEYFGIYNIRERFDDKYFEEIYDIDGSDLDYIENNGIVSEGDAQFYNQLMGYLSNNDLSNSENYNYVSKMVDINSFTDFFVTEIFINNSDWPHNNNEFWRKRVQYDSAAPYGHDGRFRWLLKDLDISFGHSYGNVASEDNLERLLYPVNNVNYDYSTLLLRRLLENEKYKEYFLNRFLDLINTNFKPDRLVNLIDSISSILSTEVHEFTERWSPQHALLTHFYPVPNKNKWDEFVEMMKDFAMDRSFYQRKYLKTHFDDEESTILIGISDLSEGIVRINTIDIDENTIGIMENTPYPWSGIYFKNVPVTLTAIPKTGYKFSHWSGEIDDTVSKLTLNLERDMYVKANFILDTEEEDSLKISDIKHDDIVIYPNPFINKVNILADIYEGDFTVYSVDGKIISKGVFNSSEIDLSEVPRGMLILELISEKGVIRKQLIKQ